MALELSHFRLLGGNKGFLRLDDANDKPQLTKFGDSAFASRLSNWFRDPGQTANQRLRTEFALVLQRQYGADFVRNVSGKIDLANATPLSARVVREIIAEGDDRSKKVKAAPLPLPGANGLATAKKAFAAASDKFIKDMQLRFTTDPQADTASYLMDAIVSYADSPIGFNTRFLMHAQRGGNPHAMKLAVALHDSVSFSSRPDLRQLNTQDWVRGALQDIMNDPAAANDAWLKLQKTELMGAQGASRMALLLNTALKSGTSPDKFKKVAIEGHTWATNAINDLEHTLEMLSNPAFSDKAPTAEAKSQLLDLRNKTHALLEQMRDPDGTFIGLRAFFAVAASDPNATLARLKQSPAGPAKHAPVTTRTGVGRG
ncbi:hypothetical protein ACFFJ7_01920 [Pseudochelatococcus lubricantis]|uniref:hypothetical protein n=1 Tax=Pseudochelatococcus lubricantis TaxID=1538102 RepID=UPI0035E6031D